MKFNFELAPNETILRDRSLSITLIGGVAKDLETGQITEQVSYTKVRDVVKNGEVVDFETKTGNLTIPRLPAEMLADPLAFLSQINTLLATLPDAAGLEITGFSEAEPQINP